jgi:hypothetical protein
MSQQADQLRCSLFHASLGRAMLYRKSTLGVLLGLIFFSFFGTLTASAWMFPRNYDWRYRVISNLLSPRDPGMPIRVPKKPSTFHPHVQRNAFRRRDVHLQSRSYRPLVSIAETQPQLQPALLRLSFAKLPGTTTHPSRLSDACDVFGCFDCCDSCDSCDCFDGFSAPYRSLIARPPIQSDLSPAG